MEVAIATKKKTKIRKALDDIMVEVSWGHISQDYFGKSRSWFSQKLNGYDGNMKDNDFTEAEIEILKGALVDLSNRIRLCADKI